MRPTIPQRLLLIGLCVCFWLSGAQLNSQESGASATTPLAVVRQSFEASKRRDFATTAALLYPDEAKRFKLFAADVFRVEKPGEQVDQLRKLFAPYQTMKSVAAATGADLFAAMAKNAAAGIEGFDELMASAKLEILGEITEGPDTVHVITRTILPRPQPVSCRKLQGRWYLLLNDQATRLMTAFERAEHFRKKKLAIEDIPTKVRMEEIKVIGHVKDGDGLAQVLCRIKARIDDFTFLGLGCYPIREGEPAWNHLADKDKTKLVEALRAKWAQ
jgi:hypothetical protein